MKFSVIAIIDVGVAQQIFTCLQLRKVFDTLADTGLKRALQRQSDAGNTDDRASLVHGIGQCRVELRPERDQARRIGGGEFEHPHETGCRVQQSGAIARFESNPVLDTSSYCSACSINRAS